MSDSNERLAVLLRRFLEDRCTRVEVQELIDIIARRPDSGTLRELMKEQWNNISETEGIADPQAKLEKMLRETRPAADETNTEQGKDIRPLWPTMNSWARVAAAAAFVLVLAGGYYLNFNGSTKRSEVSIEPTVEDIPPGSERAVLTLADGRKILLDNRDPGAVATQGNVRILKLDSGLLAYQPIDQAASADAAQYNTLETPRGGQFQVTLPDGTRVWLNAASSLRYPATFSGSSREVELTGEAYFDVATRHENSSDGSAKIPFIVRVNGMKVEVLGTHFNINAYGNEETVETTLLEGSVAVTPVQHPEGNKHQSSEHRTVLRPGQQAQIANPRMGGTGDDQEVKVVSDVNLDAVIAWKNGYFLFEHSSLPVVMRQLERWYNIDVVYAGAIPQQFFGGRIPRNLSLSQVIFVLEQNAVKCEIRGRKLIILD